MSELENVLNSLADKLTDSEMDAILTEMEKAQAEITQLKSSADALESENRELTELVEMLNGSDKELRQARMQKEDNAREAQSLKERATTLAADQQKLNRDKAVLASNEDDYKERMEEYNRIHADQEKEINNRLKAHKENLTKKLNSQYNKKQKALEKAYNDKKTALWGIVGFVCAAALIPLIGIILNVAENRTDFENFIKPIKALSDMLAAWAGLAIAAPIMLGVLTVVVVCALFGLGFWFSKQVDFSKQYFCIALAVFELLLAVNPLLPKDYNPFWISLVLFILGIVGCKVIIQK